MPRSAEGKTRTVVDGHPVALTNLDKVLWPRTGFTKGQALHYYAGVAPLMLPHLRRRPASFLRFPDGVEGQRFVSKAVPGGTPDWVRTVPVPGHEGVKTHVAVDDVATLIVMANLGALEVHVPQWRADDGPDLHDRLVIDLDPGPGRTVVDCAHVALLVREALAADGLRAYPKTSGSKGLHLYAPLRPAPAALVVRYAKAFAARLAREYPDLIVSTMARAERVNRVFIDWSQNATAKTTAAPYTLRAGPTPTVSTPLAWDELEDAARDDDLTFTAADTLDRAARYGDLLSDLPLPRAARPLPTT